MQITHSIFILLSLIYPSYPPTWLYFSLLACIYFSIQACIYFAIFTQKKIQAILYISKKRVPKHYKNTKLKIAQQDTSNFHNESQRKYSTKLHKNTQRYCVYQLFFVLLHAFCRVYLNEHSKTTIKQ